MKHGLALLSHIEFANFVAIGVPNNSRFLLGINHVRYQFEIGNQFVIE